MPSDSNGNYSLPPGYLATTGTTIQASQHNPPLEDLATAMSARLPRNGNAPMSGPLKLVDGTVGLPGLSFGSATNTGFYKTTNGFGVSVNGANVAEFIAGGGVKGARFIGELIDISFTNSTPPLCVRPYGQTLSRSAYPELWTLAQAEIATGNTFYNNGDGSTTFGIGDLRGRYRATRDSMGGTGANRLTPTFFGGNPNNIGAVKDGQSMALAMTHTPSYTPSGGIVLTNTPANFTADNKGGTANSAGGSGGYWTGNGGTTQPLAVNPTYNFSGNNNGGNSTPFSILPPSMVTDCVLFAGA